MFAISPSDYGKNWRQSTILLGDHCASVLAISIPKEGADLIATATSGTALGASAHT
jgi:hypothetical protein